MCRIAAYLGPSIALGKLLIDPPHSLQVQGWAPRELVYARLNADGYGFGWYPGTGQPAVYTNPAPIWNDPNLPQLSRALSGGLWLASVRSATPGNPVNHANTQPFADDEFLFDHNGLIDNFHEQVRAEMCAELDPQYLAAVAGNTESEYLFAALRQELNSNPDCAMETALSGLMNKTARWVGDNRALLTIVTSDGERLYAVRHALGDTSPTLYYTTDDESFPDGQLIASEPLTETGVWQTVPEHQVLILDPREPPELLPL